MAQGSNASSSGSRSELDLGGAVLWTTGRATPLILGGSNWPLGVIKIVMGWPLFLAAAYFTYRVLAPVYAELNSKKDDSES